MDNDLEKSFIEYMRNHLFGKKNDLPPGMSVKAFPINEDTIDTLESFLKNVMIEDSVDNMMSSLPNGNEEDRSIMRDMMIDATDIYLIQQKVDRTIELFANIMDYLEKANIPCRLVHMIASKETGKYLHILFPEGLKNGLLLIRLQRVCDVIINHKYCFISVDMSNNNFTKIFADISRVVFESV